MNTIEQKILAIYKEAGLTHMEAVKSLAMMACSGLAAVGEKGLSLKSENFELLMTIKVINNEKSN